MVFPARYRSLSRIALAVSTVLAVTWTSSAGPVSYSGNVRTTSAGPIAGAHVWLEGTALSTYAGADGAFTLAGDVTGAVVQTEHVAGVGPSITWRNGALAVENPGLRPLTAQAFTLDGKLILNLAMSRDPEVALPLASEKSGGIVVVRVSLDGQVMTCKIVIGKEPGRFSISQVGDTRLRTTALGKSSAVPYDLRATAPGYRTGAFPQASASATGLILTLTAQTSDSLGRFQIYYEGSGVVPNLSTGQTSSVPIEKRIHVIVFGDGYTAADLTAGKYEADLARWYREVFVVAPLDYLREAFVIWKYPIASNAHAIVDGQGDTYFKVPVTSSGISSTLDSVRAVMWRVISSQFPYTPQYYPSGGNTSQQARNMTVSFMLLDPTSGRSGYSGITTTLSNPSNANQRMSTAFALGQQHEFMHAMAKVGDEYYDAAHTPVSLSSARQESGYITNIVYSAKCDSLPWKHLLKGGQYNPGVDSLVGAFGTNGRYHPELKCLMNGSHDNTVLYGGSSNLRTDTRLCNWCREIAAFRIYERCGVLDNVATSWTTWVASYRAPFYSVIKFNTPSPIPQTNSVGTKWFLPCVQ